MKISQSILNQWMQLKKTHPKATSHEAIETTFREILHMTRSTEPQSFDDVTEIINVIVGQKEIGSYPIPTDVVRRLFYDMVAKARKETPNVTVSAPEVLTKEDYEVPVMVPMTDQLKRDLEIMAKAVADDDNAF